MRPIKPHFPAVASIPFEVADRKPELVPQYAKISTVVLKNMYTFKY